MGNGEQLYFCGKNGDGDLEFYHIPLERNKDENPCKTISLSPVATRDPDVIGRSGSWTACGEHIYVSGGLDDESKILPQLFKHNINESQGDAQWEWEIQRGRNRRPYPFRDHFAASDVVNQKLYFVGGRPYPVRGDVDGPFAPPPPDQCGECFDLRTQTWESLDLTPIKHINYYNIYHQVAAKVKDSPHDPLEIVYYDIAAGSILYLDVTNGGSSRRVVDFDVLNNFALVRRPLKPIPRGLGGVDPEDLDNLIFTVVKTPAVVVGQTFYWFNLDRRLYAYDIEAKAWLISRSKELRKRSPPPCTTPFDYPMYPLLLGLPNRKMVVLTHTSPGQITMVSFKVHKKVKNNTPFLKVTMVATQDYCFEYHDEAFVLLDGCALSNASSLPEPVDKGKNSASLSAPLNTGKSAPVDKGKNSALSSGLGGRIVDESEEKNSTTGTVLYFNGQEGVIIPNDGGQYLFFYRKDIISKVFPPSLATGEAVEFEVVRSFVGCPTVVRVVGSGAAAII